MSAQSAGSSTPATVPASGQAIPDAPDPKPATRPGAPAQTSADPSEGQQTKRILGIVPNFRSVSVNVHLPPQDAREKFNGFAEDSFDYSSFIFVGGLAGVSQLEGSTPEFHHGAAAYGRYYWHTFADQTDENLWVEFLIPTALHQDPRYYTLGSNSGGKHHGVLERAGYAFTRLLVTRTDAGGNAFNYSEIVGAGVASGISTTYYPASNRNWTKTGQRWLTNVSIDGVTLVFKEFWPDINNAIFHTK